MIVASALLGGFEMERHIGSLRIFSVRFVVLFLSSFVAWSAVLFIAHGIFAPRLGCALSDVLACLGVLVARSLDARHIARTRHLALTTAQEFPPLPVPLYLVPFIPPVYEAEIAIGTAVESREPARITTTGGERSRVSVPALRPMEIQPAA